MEPSASTAQLLIPTTGPLPGGGSGGVGGVAPAKASGDLDKTRSQPTEKSEFSNTFNDLKDQPDTAPKPVNEAETAAQTTTESPPREAPQPTETAPEAPAANLESFPELSPESLETPLPTGNDLPLAGEDLPGADLPGAELPVTTTPAPAPLADDAATPLPDPVTDPVDEIVVPVATPLPQADSGRVQGNAQSVTATRAIGGEISTPPPTLSSTTTGSGEQTGSQSGEGYRGQGEPTPSTLRDLLIQNGNQSAPRITVPVTADAGAAVQAMTNQVSNATASAPTAFNETLTSLSPDDGPALQPMKPENFGKGLGERLMVMAENGVQTARIKLHPEHLGPLDIRIQVEDDTAKIVFNAQHGQTRDALEQAMPRLREMFSEQGIQLTRSEVSGSEDFNRGQAEQSNGNPGENDRAGSEELTADPAMVGQLMRMPGIGGERLLDVMA